MKIPYYLILLLLLAGMTFGCTNKTVVVEQNDEPEEEIIYRPAPEPEPDKVKLLFQITSDYSSSEIQPDSVYINDKPIAEYSTIEEGEHDFRIEKKGYQPIVRRNVTVVDRDERGNFFLFAQMQAKERVVVFNITDQVTGESITPDQVTVISIPEGTSKTIGDRSYIKPGVKSFVIQKSGYQNATLQEVEVTAAEEPFELTAQLVPNN